VHIAREANHEGQTVKAKGRGDSCSSVHQSSYMRLRIGDTAGAGPAPGPRPGRRLLLYARRIGHLGPGRQAVEGRAGSRVGAARHRRIGRTRDVETNFARLAAPAPARFYRPPWFASRLREPNSLLSRDFIFAKNLLLFDKFRGQHAHVPFRWARGNRPSVGVGPRFVVRISRCARVPPLCVAAGRHLLPSSHVAAGREVMPSLRFAARHRPSIAGDGKVKLKAWLYVSCRAVVRPRMPRAGSCRSVSPSVSLSDSKALAMRALRLASRANINPAHRDRPFVATVLGM